MLAAEQAAAGLDPDVGGDHTEAGRDQLLRSALCVFRGCAAGAESPEQDESGDGLDDGIRAEADQRDRSGKDARTDGDYGLDAMPAEADPGQQLRPPDQSLALARRDGRRGRGKGQGSRLHPFRVIP